MAKFSDLPTELVVQIIIQTASPTGYHGAYARILATTWKKHSGSLRDAYNLAITNKKHYSAFKDQKRQIFSSVIKELLLPAEGRYNTTLQLGDMRIVSNEPEPGYEPTKISIIVVCNDAQENYYAPLIKFFQKNNIHHLVRRPHTLPCRIEPVGCVMHVAIDYLMPGKKQVFGIKITVGNPLPTRFVEIIDEED